MNRSRAAAVLSLFVCTACPSDDSDGASSESGDVATEGAGIEVVGTITDFLTETAVSGAMVCLRGLNNPCETTDAEGTITFLNVPPAELTVQITVDGYAQHLLHTWVTADSPDFGTAMIERAAAEVLVIGAGGTIDESLGAIALVVNGADGMPQADVTGSLSPDDAGVGTIYLDENNTPDPAATATSASGAYGWANIPLGDHTVSVSHPSLTCTNPRGTTVAVETDSISVLSPYACG